MKTTVIFHSADWDGQFCGQIARKFLPDAELIGWDFGDAPLPIPDGQMYVLDLPADRVFGLDFRKQEDRMKVDFERFIWIDHHKSAIDSHPEEIPGYRIDGVAACRLAYQWFAILKMTPNPEEIGIPDKDHFIDRKVVEPLAVRLAGEYDIWDKRDPRAELFQHGLRSQELNDGDWEMLLNVDTEGKFGEVAVEVLLAAGESIQYAKTKENESVIKELGFTFQWEGLTFLCCNAARYNSHLFTASLKPEHDACFGFKWTGRDWSVSLYHAPGKEHHDLLLIAVKHGGGGHRGACGFRAQKLPFLS
jgi:hypothetical protein